ncbi:MAG: hypothetical protein JNK45_28020 [Myxococcales bacterium]|nr:hypothetical protein [Myxococcales bacterium]
MEHEARRHPRGARTRGECALFVELGDASQGNYGAWWLECDAERIRGVEVMDWAITPIE